MPRRYPRADLPAWFVYESTHRSDRGSYRLPVDARVCSHGGRTPVRASWLGGRVLLELLGWSLSVYEPRAHWWLSPLFGSRSSATTTRLLGGCPHLTCA